MDLNGDGIPDLVALNSSTHTLTSALGNTNATFQPPLASPATNAGFLGGFVLANLNADNFPDVLLVNQSTNILQIFLGDGLGGFSTGQSFAVGNGPIRVAAGDVNNDGKLDALVVNEFSRSISVLLGNGDGTFQAHQDVNTGGLLASDLTLAKMNADQAPDLVVALQNNSLVAVFPGNGNGTFGTNQNFATGLSPKRVVSGDLNGDGKPDVVTSNQNGDGVSVLISNGDGTLQPKVDYATGDLPFDLALVDVDGDGDLDLVVGHLGSDYHAILLNDSHGLFTAQTPAFTANTGSSLLGDFNHDGRVDLFTPTSGGPIISLGLGSGAFDTAKQITIPGLDPTDMEFADVNSDGLIDVLLANRRSNSVEVFYSHAGSMLTYDHSIPIGSQVLALTSAMLDAGSNIDLAVITIRPDFSPGTSSNQLHVLLGAGNGQFQAQPVIPLSDRPFDVVAGDLNGDGHNDLLVLLGSAGKAAPFLGQGDGSFTAATLLDIGGTTFNVLLRDLNGDGRADFIAAPNVNNVDLLHVYLAGGDGTLALNQTITPLNFASVASFTFQDVTGDGRADLVAAVASLSGSSLVYYSANSDGTFGPEQTLVSNFIGSIKMADMNGDGRADLIGGTRISLANSTGGFDAPQSYWTSSALLTRVQDVNGDGRPDLLSANSGSSSLRVLLHR